MKRPPRMAGEPGAHVGMLVNGVVVEDRMDEFAGRHRGLDTVEETDELLVAMARHALADHGAVEDIERGEQRGRARHARPHRPISRSGPFHGLCCEAFGREAFWRIGNDLAEILFG